MYCIKVRSCTPFYGTLIQIRYFGTVTVFINDGIPVHVYLEKKIIGTVLLMSQSELCKKCCKDLTPLIFVKIRYKIKNIKYYFGCFYSILSLMIDCQ